MSGEERRAVIIDAALREFSRAGFHGASTARIAAAAECSEPMLYKHFAGKQDRFTAVLQHTSSQLNALFDQMVLHNPDGDMLERAEVGIPELFQTTLYADTMRMRMLALSVIDLPGVREALEQSNEDAYERARDAFAQGEADGTASPDLDIDYVVWMWIGVQFAACYREALAPGSFAEMLPHAGRFIASISTPHAE